ncbi:MAG: protein kinase, partial [Planctomycetota bacterium]
MSSKPPPVEFQPGMEVVPGYTLLTPLGSGMAGDVWQAQAAGGIRVALKVVRSLSDVGGRKELKALKTIRDVHHPNLCPLFGFWTKDADGRVLADGETEELTLDSSHLGQVPPELMPNAGASDAMGGTMALADFSPASSSPRSEPTDDSAKSKVRAEQLIVVMGLGDCTLYDRLKYVRQEAGLAYDDIDTPCGLEAAETIRYLRASASAIDLLNLEHDVYHFDIKPQNILLVGGEAQVCDFGLAKKIEADMRETQQTMATPAYASPEILEGESLSRSAGEQLYVDQYSLAVTYFELRTGLLPFDVTTHASMLVAKSTGKLALEALPPSERKVIQRAMRRKPKDRYGSCSEFINALAVAAGVDKAGGITATRLVLAGIVLLALAGGGLAGWRATYPDHFDSIFFQNSKSNTDRLAKASDDLKGVADDSFDGSFVFVRSIAVMAAEIGGVSTDTVQDDAIVLYRDAMDQLLRSSHEALETSERMDSVPNERMERFRQAIGLFDPDEKSGIELAAQNALLAARQLLIKSQNPDDREAAERHQLLHDALVVRYCLLAGEDSPRDVLDRIRDACLRGEGPLSDVLAETSLDSSTLAVLPLLGATGVETEEWTISQWLQSQRLEDVLRAEAFQGSEPLSTPLLSYWRGVRERFLRAISPAVVGAGRQSIDDATLVRLLNAFPDLLTESRLADLRAAVRNHSWESATELIDELDSGDVSAEVKNQVALLRDMVDNRQKSRPIGLLRESWLTHSMDPASAKRMRMDEPILGYLQFLSSQTLDPQDSGALQLHQSIDDSEWLSTQLSIPLPEELVEAMLVSRLRSIGSIGEESEDIDWTRWEKTARRFRDQSKADAFQLAIAFERAFSEESELPVEVTFAALESLDSVSAAYPSFLALCSLADRGASLANAPSVIADLPATVVRSLGQHRLGIGCDWMAKSAVNVSGITDDSFTRRRYLDSDVDDASKAAEYLRLGRFFGEHLDDGPTARLRSELLVRHAFADEGTGSDADAMLVDQLRGGEQELASNQVLLATHALSSQKIRGGSDSFELIWSGMIRPTTLLIERFGQDRFGAQKGKSAEKQLLAKQVLLPTIRDGFENVTKLDDGAVLPSIDTKIRDYPEDTLGFIELSLAVFGDPIVKDQYVSLDEWRRDRIRLAAMAVFATEGIEKFAARRAEMLWRIVDAAVGTRGLNGEELGDLADKIERLGGIAAPVEYLRSIGFHRQSEMVSDDEQKYPFVESAFARIMDALEAIESQPIANELAMKHHYEILSCSTDFAVQYAFLNRDVNRKLEVLLPAVFRGEEALGLYRDSWKETVNTLYLDTQLSLANAHEDIAYYCSKGDAAGVAARRVKNFEEAIELFDKVLSRNSSNLKTRYSSGRCKFRYAMTLSGDDRQSMLEKARSDMGETPGAPPKVIEDVNVLADTAQWFIWKLQIEAELGDTSEGSQMADFALPFIQSPRVPISHRNMLSVEAAKAFGNVRNIEKAVLCLKSPGKEGQFSSVVKRMKLLADIAMFATRDLEERRDRFAFAVET